MTRKRSMHEVDERGTDIPVGGGRGGTVSLREVLGDALGGDGRLLLGSGQLLTKLNNLRIA
jgi:hypothetical protein